MVQLASWRKKKGLSQRKLAEMAGISHITIARIETGRFDPSMGTLEKIASALGVSIATLLKPPRVAPRGISQNLRRLRTKRGLSYRALAEKAEMGYRAIFDIEHGHKVPRPKTLQRLADALEVPIEALTGEGKGKRKGGSG